MNKKVQTTINLPRELLEKLRQEATEKGYTTTDLIMFILYYYFENSLQ